MKNVKNSSRNVDPRTIWELSEDRCSLLGRGKFAEVFEVRHRVTGVVKALKLCRASVNDPKGHRLEMFTRETKIHDKIRALRSTGDPDARFLNIADTSYVYQPNDNEIEIWFILDKALCSLQDVVDGNRCGFSERVVAAALYFASRGMRFLLRSGWVHRDLKLGNLLLMPDFTVHVADFGVAEKASDPDYAICGTPGYVPPEVYMGKGHKAHSEVFSLGVGGTVLLDGCLPAEFMDKQRSSLALIRSSGAPDAAHAPVPLVGSRRVRDERLRNVLLKCVRAEAVERLSIEQLVDVVSRYQSEAEARTALEIMWQQMYARQEWELHHKGSRDSVGSAATLGSSCSSIGRPASSIDSRESAVPGSPSKPRRADPAVPYVSPAKQRALRHSLQLAEQTRDLKPRRLSAEASSPSHTTPTDVSTTHSLAEPPIDVINASVAALLAVVPSPTPDASLAGVVEEQRVRLQQQSTDLEVLERRLKMLEEENAALKLAHARRTSSASDLRERGSPGRHSPLLGTELQSGIVRSLISKYGEMQDGDLAAEVLRFRRLSGQHSVPDLPRRSSADQLRGVEARRGSVGGVQPLTSSASSPTLSGAPRTGDAGCGPPTPPAQPFVRNAGAERPTTPELDRIGHRVHHLHRSPSGSGSFAVPVGLLPRDGSSSPRTHRHHHRHSHGAGHSPKVHRRESSGHGLTRSSSRSVGLADEKGKNVLYSNSPDSSPLVARRSAVGPDGMLRYVPQKVILDGAPERPSWAEPFTLASSASALSTDVSAEPPPLERSGSDSSSASHGSRMSTTIASRISTVVTGHSPLPTVSTAIEARPPSGNAPNRSLQDTASLDERFPRPPAKTRSRSVPPKPGAESVVVAASKAKPESSSSKDKDKKHHKAKKERKRSSTQPPPTDVAVSSSASAALAAQRSDEPNAAAASNQEGKKKKKRTLWSFLRRL
eukprot:TRINITY_DN10033_c0_g1_i1.p1 TRINITY_DN10033_c0_g1~~TRINITY_DN10033_c0_g1_i1.p1  ORF type:complete len:943 (+),score=247.67 TRINITY_DN10033_c0_g1_i1:102-2930(+)